MNLLPETKESLNYLTKEVDGTTPPPSGYIRLLRRADVIAGILFGSVSVAYFLFPKIASHLSSILFGAFCVAAVTALWVLAWIYRGTLSIGRWIGLILLTAFIMWAAYYTISILSFDSYLR